MDSDQNSNRKIIPISGLKKEDVKVMNALVLDYTKVPENKGPIPKLVDEWPVNHEMPGALLFVLVIFDLCCYFSLFYRDFEKYPYTKFVAHYLGWGLCTEVNIIFVPANKRFWWNIFRGM